MTTSFSGEPSPRTPPPPTIAVDGLRMRYGDTDVLRGISFTVTAGEVLALLGPNGAGKTTTIEVLEGFRHRSSGDVKVLGSDPQRARERWRARVGIVLQSWRDHGRWTPRELISHIAEHYVGFGDEKHPRPRKVEEVLELVGITAHADKPMNSLSGGQRRRVDVAAGVIGRPEVLFLDEPTAGFDPQARQDFHQLVRTLASESTTIMLTTHDLYEAEALSDRIVILDEGHIVASGTADELTKEAAEQPTLEWTEDGRRHRLTVDDPTATIRHLMAEGRAVEDIDIHRTDLTQVYLSLLQYREGTAQSETRSPRRWLLGGKR